jgi:translation initiation factor 1
MGTLQDLAQKLGATNEAPSNRKRGFDGQALNVKARVEKRRGKVLTIVWGFQCKPKELDRLLTLCKKTLGSGGVVADQQLELQGDHTKRVVEIMRAEGYCK